VPIGVFSTSSNPTPAAPTASFPISQRQNFNTVSQASDVWLFRPNLRTPYVQEWNLSVQRELWNRLTIEARYVGNHAVKLFRSWNINELNLVNNGLVDEFKRAQNNLAIAGNNFSNQGHPGQTPLPIFEKLFAGFLPGEGFANSDFITWLRQNQIGSMFDSIRRTPLYQANREANFPLNFFVPNPFANQAVMVDNSSWSIYHGGVLEVARRFSSGLFFQGNYTLGKVLTDTRFLSSNQEFQRFRKINDRSLDKNRAAFDVRHSFSSNFVYPLPLGTGKWLATDAGPILNKLIGGWNVQGLTRWSSGSPFSIISNRRTTGSLDLAATADIPASLRNMTASDLQKKIGVFRTPNGVFWLDPKSGLVTVSGSTSRAVLCQPGQTTPCFDHPGVNQEGNLPFLGFDSPRFFTQDLSMIKRTAIPSISEAFNLEIRVEFFNAFNNANFNGLAGTGRSAADTIDSANFGQLTSTVDTVGGGVTSRIIQWAVKVNF
jgi:hypothetical protein